MDFISELPRAVQPEKPLFINEAAQIAAELARCSRPALSRLMGISPPIAMAVQSYYAAWDAANPGRPALWVYTGDVYKGLQAKTLSPEAAQWAQQHLLIVSGLYGLVRPFDGIQAYRLDMKAQVKIGRGLNLYDFWGDQLANYIAAQGSEWMVSCCSKEYSRAIFVYNKLPVITPTFFDSKPNGVVGQVPIYSKMMRGVMARWLIDNRPTKPADLKAFTKHGYSYDALRSNLNGPAFSRLIMTPLKFET